jgi:hypothetical protein
VPSTATGFLVFIIAFASSVIVLVILSMSALFSSEPRIGDAPRRILYAAAIVYCAGVGVLWLPGEILCSRVPILQRLPLHAIFHLTSAAGPHLGLTAFALARFDDEHPTAPPSIWFGGLPAIERGAAALSKQA